MKPVLIYLRPLDRRTNARVDIRTADAPSAEDYGTSGVSWAPGILQRPSMSIELMSLDMDGQVQAGQARFTLSLARLGYVGDPTALYWRGASVVIHNTGVLEGADAVPDFWGNVTSETVDLERGTVQITAEASVAFLDKPLLVDTFTGGGGLTGDPEKRGTFLPAGFGAVFNIEPVWFDLTNNIGMIDGYANTQSISWLGEGLSSFGAPVGNYADYDALKAAVLNKTIAPGRWGMSVQPGKPGLVALGAPPVGVITVHAVFGTNRTGALMRRILETHAKVPVARLDTASFTALDTAVDRAVHYWTADQRQVKDLLEALAQAVNATPLVSFQNKVSVTRAVTGNPVATLDRSGAQDPRVLDWRATSSDAPFYRMTARAVRPARVLSLEQVNYVDTLIDRGLYRDETTYRAGNLVWLGDNSQWVYTNTIASAGHRPPYDSNGQYIPSDAWWTNTKPPQTNAGAFTYLDGTPIDALKPAEKGATAGAPNGTFIGGVEASALVNRIAQARAQADDALAKIAAIALDNNLSRDEKPALVQQVRSIDAEFASLRTNAIQRGISYSLAQASYDDLKNYLASLSPAYDNFGVDTPIIRSDFNNAFVGYTQRALALRAALDTDAFLRESAVIAEINKIASDGVLSKGEKPWIVEKFDAIVLTFNEVKLQGQLRGVGVPEYENSVGNLRAYLESLNPGYRDYTADTNIDPASLHNGFVGAYQEEAQSRAALDTNAANREQAAQTRIDSISSDSVLDRSEKYRAVIEWQGLNGYFDAYNAQFLNMNQPAALAQPQQNAFSNLSALGNYLGGLNPSWEDSRYDTNINASQYRNLYIAAYRAIDGFAAAMAAYQGSGGGGTPTPTPTPTPGTPVLLDQTTTATIHDSGDIPISQNFNLPAAGNIKVTITGQYGSGSPDGNNSIIEVHVFIQYVEIAVGYLYLNPNGVAYNSTLEYGYDSPAAGTRNFQLIMYQVSGNGPTSLTFRSKVEDI